MKITKVIGYGLTSPLKSDFVYYGYNSNAKNIGVIEVHTDSGIVGYGETYAGVYCAELIEHSVKLLERYLIGQPVQSTNIIDNIPYIGKGGLVKSIYSGVEIAIYDALSKAAKKPLWEYLGGEDIEPRLYASNGSAKFTPKEIEEDVKQILDLGFTSYKMRIGVQSISEDLKRLETARKYLGDNNLMVDAIMGTNPVSWNYDQALKWSEDLLQFNVKWLEEPFRPEKIRLYQELNKDTKISIAGGEALNQLWNFEDYYHTKAVDIIQPDVTNSGGIKDVIKVIDLFKPENTALHVWGSKIAINSNYHVAKSKQVSYLEIPMMELQINDELKKTDYGIGVEVTEDIKQKYKLRIEENFKI